MQIDPIGYEDQWNLYAYVGNDPVNKIDRTGMKIPYDADHPQNQAKGQAAMAYLSGSETHNQNMAALEASSDTYTIFSTAQMNSKFDSDSLTIIFNVESTLQTSNGTQPPAT